MKVEMTTESGDLRVETTDSQMGHWLQLTRLGKEAATQWTHVMFHVWPHLPPFSFLVKLQKNICLVIVNVTIAQLVSGISNKGSGKPFNILLLLYCHGPVAPPQ